MYEHKKQPLASRSQFFSRIFRQFGWSLLIVGFSLLFGTVGFYLTAPHTHDWYDCLHNASMMMSGMEPLIKEYDQPIGKIFSSFYALYSGIALTTNIGLLMAPVVHRLFHKLHLEES